VQRNEIVVYQPDGEIRIEAHFEGETVWLPQSLIAKLFSCSAENVRLHLKNIYASGELDKGATSKESLEVRQEGSRNVMRRFTYYNLDATSEHRDGKGNPRPKILPADVAKFNAQYPTLFVRFRENFHDRFLVVDDRELYLIGASLKDLGKKCFGFTKMDPAEIPGLMARM